MSVSVYYMTLKIYFEIAFFGVKKLCMQPCYGHYYFTVTLYVNGIHYSSQVSPF